MNKKIRERIIEIENEINKMREEKLSFLTAVAEAQKALSDFNNRFAQLHKEKDELKRIKPDTTITDHAFLRYVERIYKWPVDEIKKDLLNKLPDPLPNGRIEIDGVEFRCRDNALITVIEK